MHLIYPVWWHRVTAHSFSSQSKKGSRPDHVTQTNLKSTPGNPYANTVKGSRLMRAQAGLAWQDILVLAVLALSVCAHDAAGQKMPASTQGPSVAPTFLLGNPSDYAGINT